ncbi:piggyBac transposable element-derived protein 4-like [Acropora millepora]|uniref:piggyBac transposable element-derived protein 4-like n=1 Tax=Acropora millepora TaxID=45264 RepID=UPI0010FC67CA|nr:piggyBac transposable element-derived protein 4-like [Acropora millepora]
MEFPVLWSVITYSVLEAPSSEEEDFSDDDLVDVFGESEDEDDFVGFNFTLPDDIHWETDEDGAKTRRFYDDNPRNVFCRDNVGPTINELPGEKRLVDIFQLFISDELLEKIARSTNDWFQVKKGSEPNKHKAPFELITYINELKSYFGILLAVNQGHCLFVDNWYSSLALCIFLKSRGIYLCGTTRSNRRGYPAELKAFRAPAQNRDASSLRVYQGVEAFVSKDSKPVHFLSTAHYPGEVATVQGQQKERRGGRYSVKEVESHKIVVDYNANMGAVDTNDQMTTVRKSRKQLRWYMRLIVKFLEISAYNSYIIEGHFKEHLHERQRKRDFTAFREDLIHELVGHWRTEKARRGRKRKETPFRLENVGEHFPVKGAGSDHTCQVCREKRRRFMANSPDVPKAHVPLKLTKTTFKCEVCDVYLCISRENNCFQSWPP